MVFMKAMYEEKVKALMALDLGSDAFKAVSCICRCQCRRIFVVVVVDVFVGVVVVFVVVGVVVHGDIDNEKWKERT